MVKWKSGYPLQKKRKNTKNQTKQAVTLHVTACFVVYEKQKEVSGNKF